MTKNWIWAGGFLALVVSGIGFGAKAGVESGRAALRLESARAEHEAVDAKHETPPSAGHLVAARSVRADARHDVEEKTAPAPREARARAMPTRLEARAETAPAQVERAPRLKLRRDRPAGPAGRLFTPASELDIAFATGRIDSLEPRREAKVEVEDVDAQVGTPGVADAAKDEVEIQPEAGTEETPAEPANVAEAPEAEATVAEPVEAEAPEAPAPAGAADEITAPRAETDDVEEEDEAAPAPAVEANDSPSETAEATPEAEFEEWPDETEGDLYPYASRVEVDALGRSPARI